MIQLSDLAIQTLDLLLQLFHLTLLVQKTLIEGLTAATGYFASMRKDIAIFSNQRGTKGQLLCEVIGQIINQTNAGEKT